jgi:hypothetical protein
MGDSLWAFFPLSGEKIYEISEAASVHLFSIFM